jgi:Immunoglobulin I-set domain.
VPPKIIDEETSGDIEVPEGGNITLQCRAKGNPTPRISWKRDDSRPIKLKRGRDNNGEKNTFRYTVEPRLFQLIGTGGS